MEALCILWVADLGGQREKNSAPSGASMQLLVAGGTSSGPSSVHVSQRQTGHNIMHVSHRQLGPNNVHDSHRQAHLAHNPIACMSQLPSQDCAPMQPAHLAVGCGGWRRPGGGCMQAAEKGRVVS